jgi:hypothetical protein
MRPCAWVAEITCMLNLGGWPEGMRVNVRKERLATAQLRFTDIAATGSRLPPAPKAGSLLT